MGKTFNMNLDEGTEVAAMEVPVGAEEVKVDVPPEPKFMGDIIMLPIPSIDEEGNSIVTCKNIESVSSEEFLKWMYTVLPFPEDIARRFIGLKKSGKGWDDVRNRIGVFNTIIRMHEARWMFGQGVASNEKNN